MSSLSSSGPPGGVNHECDKDKLLMFTNYGMMVRLLRIFHEEIELAISFQEHKPKVKYHTDALNLGFDIELTKVSNTNSYHIYIYRSNNMYFAQIELSINDYDDARVSDAAKEPFDEIESDSDSDKKSKKQADDSDDDAAGSSDSSDDDELYKITNTIMICAQWDIKSIQLDSLSQRIRHICIYMFTHNKEELFHDKLFTNMKKQPVSNPYNCKFNNLKTILMTVYGQIPCKKFRFYKIEYYQQGFILVFRQRKGIMHDNESTNRDIQIICRHINNNIAVFRTDNNIMSSIITCDIASLNKESVTEIKTFFDN